MSKRWLAPILLLAWIAGPVATAVGRDRDHDRLSDKWERRYSLSTAKRSAAGDPDHDGLTNRREFRLHTNPRRKDTDHDRLRDGREVKRYHTNPRKKDTDGDGLSDRAEVRAGTDPRDRASHPVGTPAPPAAPGIPRRPVGPPTPANVGVPAGWAPAQTRNGNVTVSRAGAVVQDMLIVGGNLIVTAPNVTVRRVKLQGGRIDNGQGQCRGNGLTVEDSTFEPPPGQQYDTNSEGATGTGGYTARRVLLWRRSEGFRDGGKASGCGPVTIQDSFAKISIPPGCPGDPHSDGIQGYNGPPLTVRNVTIDFNEASCGTAPVFVPADQGNTTVTIDGMLVMGGGYAFRVGVPGTVRDLKIVDRSWYYGAVEVNCSLLGAWEAKIVTIDANYHVTHTVGPQRCTG